MSVDPNIFPNIYCLLQISCTLPVTSADKEQANSTALELNADYHDDGKTVSLGANESIEHTLTKAREL